MWANFHTHSTYCDGKTSLEELVIEGETQRLLSLGLSSHAPLPFERPWAMKRERFSNYLAEIASLRKADRRVEIYSGLEVDYVPGLISPATFAHQLDYTIGSIHFVDQFDDGQHWEIDNTREVFLNGLNGIFKGDIRAAITRYYELTREMLENSTPTVVGHMDKIKMHNTGNAFFREDDGWYRNEINKTVRAIAKSGSIVEINTRGIYQKKTDETYPSLWIIELLWQNSVPVMINSDAHHPKDLTTGFADAASTLLNIGYRSVKIMHDGVWKDFRITTTGIVN